MNSQIGTHFDGLRGELYAPEHVWVDEVDEFLEQLDASFIENWDVNATICDNGEARVSTNQERYAKSYHPETPNEFVQFSFTPGIDRGWWLRAVQHFWVGYTTRWESQYGSDIDFTSSSNSQSSRSKKPRFVVGGLLADVIITESLDEAVEHVTEQFERVADRLWFAFELERFAPNKLRPTPEDTTDADAFEGSTCPLSASGIGETTIKRLANHFAVPSNALLYEEESLYGCLSTSYGNRPDIQTALENTETAVSRYQRFHKQGATQSALQPEDLEKYPMHPPVIFPGCHYSSHTTWDDE